MSVAGEGGRNVRKYCTECTVTCLVVAKELFILCALFIPSSHHSSFSVSFMPCSYLWTLIVIGQSWGYKSHVLFIFDSVVLNLFLNKYKSVLF